jgi:hypothetical protein
MPKSKDKLSIEEAFVVGSNNSVTTDIEVNKPLVVRGVTDKTEMDRCEEQGRDFYYIDTGYVGNFPSIGNPKGSKIWHRVVKNKMQHDIIEDAPSDRWEALVKQDPNLEFKGWKKYNQKILFVPPNPKACKAFNIDYDKWMEETKQEIQKYSDLPIETRIKGSRTDRNHKNTIYDALQGAYAVVTFNSIAALEAVLFGVPAFVAVPCVASPLSSNNLEKLQDPFYPSEDLIKKQCYNLAYGQFTVDEFKKGTAWQIINQRT